MISSSTYKLANDYSLILACYHEAGQALMATNNYFYVNSIVVDKFGGEVIHDRLLDYEHTIDKKLLKKVCILELQICYAGLVAEKYFYSMITGKNSIPRFLSNSSAMDLSYASGLIRKYNICSSGKKTHELKTNTQIFVDEFIHKNWLLVKLIATHLYQHKTIKGIKLKSLIINNSSKFYYWNCKFNSMNEIYNSSVSEVDVLDIIDKR
jgi:hypothetical protein